jgi:hypothetical protein
MRARIAIAIMFIVGAFVGATPARADGDGPPGLWSSPPAPLPAEEQPREKLYYGWKLIPVDLASVSLIAVGSDGVRKVGVTGYLASGLIFHVLHDNGNQAARSVFMRAGLPALGWVVGGLLGGLGTNNSCYDQDGCDNDWIRWGEFWDHEGAVAGAFVGLGTALVFDWAKLAWAEKPSPTERSILAPQVTIDEQSLTIGVLGQF